MEAFLLNHFLGKTKTGFASLGLAVKLAARRRFPAERQSIGKTDPSPFPLPFLDFGQ